MRNISPVILRNISTDCGTNLWAIYGRGLGNSGLGRRLCPPRDQVGEQCVSRETPCLLLLSLQIMRVFMHLLIIKALFVCKLLFDTLAHPVSTTVLLVISRFCYFLQNHLLCAAQLFSKPLVICRPIIRKLCSHRLSPTAAATTCFTGCGSEFGYMLQLHILRGEYLTS